MCTDMTNAWTHTITCTTIETYSAVILGDGAHVASVGQLGCVQGVGKYFVTADYPRPMGYENMPLPS